MISDNQIMNALIKMSSWVDPNPEPVTMQYGNYFVIRDDLLEHGSKIRFIDYLIGHDPDYENIKEWVFGSCPATGYAQISLPIVCNKYGKKAVLFMADRDKSKLHPYQQRGITNGAEYHWVPNGMLNVTQARAREYVAENPLERALLPIGLEHPTVTASITKVARQLETPDVFWTVGSSGTLNRGLQLAWPNAEAHVVSVGHNMKDYEIGNAYFHKSAYKFDKPTKVLPPFPSAPTYDAKAWELMENWHNIAGIKGNRILFWNVGA